MPKDLYWKCTRALSRWNYRIQSSPFHPCVIGRKLPMGLGLALVPLQVPCLDLGEQGSLGRETAPKALATPRAECPRRPVAPTALFGSRRALECLGDSLGLRGGKGVLQRRCRGGVQMVPHEAHVLSVRRMLLNQCFDPVRPSNCCPRRCDCCPTLSGSRCES